MDLTKENLKQIKEVVKDTIQETVPDIVEGIVGKKVDELAVITKRSFDIQGKDIEDLKIGQKLIRKDTAGIHYIVTEMVRREEFLELKMRVEKLEEKVKILK